MKTIRGAILAVMILVGLAASGGAEEFAGKKILFIDSYHEGYVWSDGILNGVRGMLEGTGVQLEVVRMDTYRNPGDAYAAKAGEAVRDTIFAYEPDVVIAADDNASKFVLVPFFMEADIPFVFCGVNWDAEQYGFPVKNVTGMVEVAPARELIEHLKPYAEGTRIGFIAMDNPTNRREFQHLSRFEGLEFASEAWAESAEDFKTRFLQIQEEVDILYIDPHGGMWSDEEKQDVQAFVEANTQVPTGTCIEFMAPYALLGFSKVPQEQGEWAGKAALRILGGTSPSEIPLVVNTKGSLTINRRIEQALGIHLPRFLYELATRVIE